MKVIGFRKSSFKGNDGTEVSGVNLYLTDKCEKGEGLSCDRIYVMDKILASCGYTPKLNDEVITVLCCVSRYLAAFLASLAALSAR